MPKTGFGKVQSFLLHVEAVIDEALKVGFCYVCLSKLLYIEYGISALWKMLRRFDVERKIQVPG